jgi:hypothetical protein
MKTEAAVKMPKVFECMVANCAYNSNRCCHAPAITVGGPEPRCDTYVLSKRKGGDQGCSGSVGACKVATCQHNRELVCTAEGIQVEPTGSQPRCMTFQPLGD